MIHETPPKINGWTFSPANVLKKAPKFAVRLGFALGAVSVAGIAYTFMADTHPKWMETMAYLGLASAFLTSFFAKR